MLRRALRLSNFRRLSSTPSLHPPSIPPPLDLFDDDILNDLYSPPTPSPTPPSSTPDIFLYNRSEQAAYKRQLELEEHVTELAIERFRKLSSSATARGDVVANRSAAELVAAWFGPLTVALQNSLSEDGGSLRRNRRRGRRAVEALVRGKLNQISAEAASVVAIHVALSELMRNADGVPVTRLAMLIGHAIRAEINLCKLGKLKKMKGGEDRKVKGTEGKRAISMVNYAAQEAAIEGAKWEERELAMVGGALLEMLVGVAKVDNDELVPAFESEKRYRKSGKCNVAFLQLSEAAMRVVGEDGGVMADCCHVKYMPMLVRPRPWMGWRKGPYLRSEVGLVRMMDEGELHGGDLGVVFDGLNALGETRWKVNEGVFEVAEELWKRGGRMAGLPDRKDVEGKGWKVKKVNRELVGLRADVEHKLEHARRFKEEECLWLPHNMDFRGRAYPIAVHLQHMGCDLTRAMLTFAKPGVMLGEKGVWWLKVHLANKLGKDKLSFAERVEVAEDNMSRAIQVGREPLKDSNLEWWTKAEDPFQLLAVCQELAQGVGKWGREDALKGFESCLPVAMDGSCNGLQHYAALGRDLEGGIQVNLVPNDRPQDVYQGVAQLVRERVEKLAEEGDEIAQLLRGKVTRKVVKQTVMTSVYGVTHIGARQQIGNRLAEIEGFPEDKLFAASRKLAKLTLSSLGDIFSGATRTMDWLYESASRISKHGQQVRWTTPVGLPVAQPYRQNGRVVVKTLMHRMTLERNNEHSPVSTARQRSAFAPNFVHSIDSAHMLLTAIACRRQNLPFAAVHDSFWTNAAHVDSMNGILREEFVKLHQRDLLAELRDGFQFRYPHVKLQPLPPRGHLQLHVVHDSPYFFS